MMTFQREVDDKVNEVKDSINNADATEKLITVDSSMLVSTGSTLVNLALSDRIEGGFVLGSMVNLVGDSDAGKSLLAMMCYAECVRDKRFSKYQLKYGNIEVGIRFPMEAMFGEHIDRVEFFPTNRKDPYTIQQWHEDLLSWTKKPIIHTTDSWDALTTETIVKKAEAGESGKSFPEKAIISSSAWPTVIGQVEQHKSLLVVISQTREKIGSLFSEKYRQGGNALRFFATCEPWIRKVGKITKTIRGHKVHIGDWVQCDVKRTRITGKKRSVKFPVYYEYGIDDIESMIEWMVDWKFWDKEKKKKSEVEEGEEAGKVIDTCGDFINGKIETLIKHIEDNNLEQELKEIVQESWDTLEAEILTNRKKRYS